jgi:hypothetical protein
MKISVTAEALREVLVALNGPGHLIRELQATRNIGDLLGKKNPIDLLLEEFNSEVNRINTENGDVDTDKNG